MSHAWLETYFAIEVSVINNEEPTTLGGLLMSDNSEDDGKTRRLDDDYFKEIARKAKSQNFDGDKTQLVTKKGKAEGVAKPESQPDDNRTRVYRSTPSNGTSKSNTQMQQSAMDDPPVGWLVATQGPGKGCVLTIGIGMNTIGRGSEPRITIPFDDDEISRGKSFSIAYDEKNAQFHLLPGEGKTLVYFDGRPVLSGVSMHSHMKFQIGQTTFIFLPLCGAEFNWESD